MNSTVIATKIRRILSMSSNPLLDANRNKIINIAIARSLSVYFPLPTSAVPSVGIHFTRSFSTPLHDFLSKINESLVIDIRGIIDLTAKFYELRYNLVFKANEFLTTLPALAIAMPEYFPTDTRKVMEDELNRLRNDQGIVDTQSHTYIEYYNSWLSLIKLIGEEIQLADNKLNNGPTGSIVG